MADLKPITVHSGRIVITKKRVETVSMDCPSCSKPMDVSNALPQSFIGCPCGNITYFPGFQPAWYQKTLGLVALNVVSLIVGIVGTLIVEIWILPLLK